MKVILYARFSPRPKRPGAEPKPPDVPICESAEHQIAAMREWCKANGHEVVAEPFVDEEKSGDDFDRPGIWAAVDAIKRGYLLVVWKFDRLARDTFLSYSIERDVLKAGGQVVSASGEGTIEQNMRPEDKLKIGMLRLFAEYEKAVIAARTKAAMLRHQANGRRMSAECPYGQEVDPESELNGNGNSSRMKSNPEEAVVIEAVKHLHGLGMGPTAIARQLQARGYKPRGQCWHHQTVRRILARCAS